MDRIIYDRADRRYALEFDLLADSSFLRGSVYHNASRVGYANCIIDGTIMSLNDIHISEAVPFRECSLVNRALQFVRLKPRVVNFRRRGVGTQLLLAVLQYAREHAIHEVKGRIVRDDQIHNPGLANWYRKHGFSVSESSEILLKLR